jgi:hypothetical protein
MKYLLVFLLLTTSVSAQVVDGTFPVVSNLKAGAAKVDITPEEVKDLTVSGHTRVVNGVRDPLRAGVLVLDDGETKAAIVTLDVVVAWDDLVTRALRSRKKSACRLQTSWSVLHTITRVPVGKRILSGPQM